MRTNRYVALALGLVVLLTAVATPAEAKRKKKLLTDIPMEWRPTSEIGDHGPVEMTGLFDVKIQFDTFEDTREDKAKVGENREDEDEGVLLPVTTTDDVAAWATDRFAYLFNQYGFTTVESGGDVVISAEIMRFFVDEDNTYEADLGFRISVTSAAGETIWEGRAAGTASRWGRSYKDENYFETIADALIDATHKLTTNPGFLEALRNSV